MFISSSISKFMGLRRWSNWLLLDGENFNYLTKCFVRLAIIVYLGRLICTVTGNWWVVGKSRLLLSQQIIYTTLKSSSTSEIIVFALFILGCFLLLSKTKQCHRNCVQNCGCGALPKSVVVCAFKNICMTFDSYYCSCYADPNPICVILLDAGNVREEGKSTTEEGCGRNWEG